MKRFANFPVSLASVAPLLFTLVLFGCADGGSGSSGFLTENAAIGAALESNTCVEYEGLRICAAPTQIDSASPAPTPSSTPIFATPTPPGTPASTATPTVPNQGQAGEISFDSAPDAQRSCAVATDDVCQVQLDFNPRGFGAGVGFLVAVRQEFPAGPWQILVPSGATSPESLSVVVPIAVPAHPAPGPILLQTAVLVYEHDVPSTVPASVSELIDAGPDEVFVTSTFEVTPVL